MTQGSWEFRGLTGAGDPPPSLNAFAGRTALIVGCGRCVWDDLGRFVEWAEAPEPGKTLQRRLFMWAMDKAAGHDVIAVNEVGIHLDCKLRHWVSLHPDHLLTRVVLRRQVRSQNEQILLHSTKEPKKHSDRPLLPGTIDVVWRGITTGAMSGIFAAKVAVLLGYDRIILAGVPMDATGRYYDPPDEHGCAGDWSIIKGLKSEIANCPELKLRVRSLSGKTRELLGEPERCAS